MDNKPRSTFLYPLVILSGVIGTIVTFVNSFQAIYAVFGLAVSMILIGVGVLGWFVSQKKITLGDGIQYSVIWTLLILLAGTGYYLIISQSVTISGVLYDNNLNRSPVSNYEIELHHKQTGVRSQVRTDAEGNFTFSDVKDGEFDIFINGVIIRSGETLSGIQKLIQGNIRAGSFYLESIVVAQLLTPTSPSLTPTVDNPTITSTSTPHPTNTPQLTSTQHLTDTITPTATNIPPQTVLFEEV